MTKEGYRIAAGQEGKIPIRNVGTADLGIELPNGKVVCIRPGQTVLIECDWFNREDLPEPDHFIEGKMQ